MVDVSRQPAEWRIADWREFAAIYLERAETAKDPDLRKQFSELARRHLEMAVAIGKPRSAAAPVTPVWMAK